MLWFLESSLLHRNLLSACSMSGASSRLSITLCVYLLCKQPGQGFHKLTPTHARAAVYQRAISCTANQSKQKKLFFFFKEKRHWNVYTLRNYNSARRTGSLLYFHDGINISGKQRGVWATCRKLGKWRTCAWTELQAASGPQARGHPGNSAGMPSIRYQVYLWMRQEDKPTSEWDNKTSFSKIETRKRIR